MIANEPTIPPEVLASLHQRRSAGERLSSLAKEVGITWQRLWVLLVSTQPKTELPAARPPSATAALDGHQHAQFADVLALVQEGAKNILMVGPAGSGKTTLAKDVAEAMELDYGFLSLSAGITETHLFGRLLPQDDGTWAYVASRFVEVYENGGVFLLDEVDAADANVMVSVNAALANGVLSNPVSGKLHVRHERCIIIAAANTFGRGGDHMYVGRNALDAATLDRFVLDTLAIDYDGSLERAIAAGRGLDNHQVCELLGWVDGVRTKIADNRLRRVASTRLVERGARAISAGKALADVKARYFQDWSPDERAKVGEEVRCG